MVHAPMLFSHAFNACFYTYDALWPEYQSLGIAVLLMAGIIQRNGKIYLNDNWQPCRKSDAYYKRRWQVFGPMFKIEDTDMNGIKISSGYVARLYYNDAMNMQGHWVYYHKNGNRTMEGIYLYGHMAGTWKYYNPATNNLVREIQYKGGLMQRITSFSQPGNEIVKEEFYEAGVPHGYRRYNNGALVEERLPDGTATHYYERGGIRKREVFDGNKLCSATYYDEAGQELDATEELGQYQYVERMPAPGYDLMQYLEANLRYPEPAKLVELGGRVMISFIVNEDGRIIDATVSSGVHPLLDQEALRVVAKMPPWHPGMQNGKPVKVSYSQPITFKIDEEKK